jgi:hypothetical protein
MPRPVINAEKPRFDGPLFNRLFNISAVRRFEAWSLRECIVKQPVLHSDETPVAMLSPASSYTPATKTKSLKKR